MKKYLVIILSFLFLFNIDVYAKVQTLDRNDYDNYGVKKDFKINNHNLSNVLRTEYVDSSEKIYDFAEILTEEENQKLKSLALEFVDKTNMDLVILTINEPYTYDSYNEDRAADFYDYNDFGLNFKSYSGIALLRNAYSNDPYYNMYTFGEAQLYYDYDRMETILDGIYNKLSNHLYYDGFSDFISYVERYYDKGIPSSNKHYYIDENYDVKLRFVPPLGLASIISFVVTLIIILVLVSRNKMVIKPTRAQEYLNGSSVHFTEQKDTFKNSITTSHTISSSSGSHSSGHSRSHSRGSSGGGHSRGSRRHG